MKTITMKFGGTSVGSIEAIQNVIQIVRDTNAQGDRAVLVVSAMNGVTDTLIGSVQMALGADKWGYMSVAQKLRDRHEETLTRLVPPGEDRQYTMHKLNKLLDEYAQLCSAIGILGEATPRVMDTVISFGERLSSRMIAAALRAEGVTGAKAYDASEFVVTDDNHQNAGPIWDLTEERIRVGLIPALEQGITPVVTGFIGATQEGAITTLGRGGSDYSGAIFAAYTESDELIIWTDVDGVMTTDPRIDKRARVLPYVSYQEVGELAFYGAKVLHPKTIHPILLKGVPVRVRNTFNPSHPGTTITHEAQPSETIIKAVTAVRNVSMLTVSGRGMLGVPGIAGRTFLAVARAGASILMISQSSSEQSFCFVVIDDKSEAARNAVENELGAEIARGHVDGVEILHDVAIVTAVGAGMRGAPGVAGRVFTAMGDTGVNVLSIAQGSSECSISFIVAEADLNHAVVTLHNLALVAVPQ